MVEVFKTNVKNPGTARMLVRLLQRIFVKYEVNFDLEDCDNILRVKCETQEIHSGQIIHVLAELGFLAEILEDNVPPTEFWSHLKYQQQLN